MMGVKSHNSCRDLLKRLQIVTLPLAAKPSIFVKLLNQLTTREWLQFQLGVGNLTVPQTFRTERNPCYFPPCSSGGAIYKF
jgi:hypothetical protein